MYVDSQLLLATFRVVSRQFRGIVPTLSESYYHASSGFLSLNSWHLRNHHHEGVSACPHLTIHTSIGL